MKLSIYEKFSSKLSLFIGGVHINSKQFTYTTHNNIFNAYLRDFPQCWMTQTFDQFILLGNLKYSTEKIPRDV